MGDFLPPNPHMLVAKLTEAKMKRCFFQGQPKTWKQQFKESPNAPKPDDTPLDELKEHFKVKEENSFKSQQHNSEKQKNEMWKKCKAMDQGDEKSGHSWKKQKGKDKSNKQKGSDRSTKPKLVEKKHS